jgi:hypothetical protein
MGYIANTDIVAYTKNIPRINSGCFVKINILRTITKKKIMPFISYHFKYMDDSPPLRFIRKCFYFFLLDIYLFIEIYMQYLSALPILYSTDLIFHVLIGPHILTL